MEKGLLLHFKHCHFSAAVIGSFAAGDRARTNVLEQEFQRRQCVVWGYLVL